jgi:hypothetical protein
MDSSLGEPMDRAKLINDANNYADQLIAYGDVSTFEAVFGTDDINLDMATLSTESLQEISDEYRC